MDSTILQAALPQLDIKLEELRRVKRQLEREHWGGKSDGPFYEAPQAAFEYQLNILYEVLLIVLEGAGLPDTRLRLQSCWAGLETNGIGKGDYDEEFQYFENKPFEYLSHIVDGLRTLLSGAVQSYELFEVEKLETILRKTPTLLYRRGIQPMKEGDILEVMRDYLDAFFTEFQASVRIPSLIRKNFQPDCGIRNLKAAIEFKYATTKNEVKRALSGVFEDIAAYSGSLDWVRYYAVVYQTSAFESEDRFRSELKGKGALTWVPILVTGEGSRKRRTKSRSVGPIREDAQQ